MAALTLPLLLTLLLLLLLITDVSSVSAPVLLILPATSKLLPLLLLLLSFFAPSPTAAPDGFGFPAVGRDQTEAVSPIDANTSNQSCSSAL
jgi:hypothetical protein